MPNPLAQALIDHPLPHFPLEQWFSGHCMNFNLLSNEERQGWWYWESMREKKISQSQHTSAELHPKANKWPTYCSVKHRADSHMEKLPSEVQVRPWYV